MFAKQQERINRYIKDGSLPNQILPIAEKINSVCSQFLCIRSHMFQPLKIRLHVTLKEEVMKLEFKPLL